MILWPLARPTSLALDLLTIFVIVDMNHLVFDIKIYLTTPVIKPFPRIIAVWPEVPYVVNDAVQASAAVDVPPPLPSHPQVQGPDPVNEATEPVAHRFDDPKVKEVNADPEAEPHAPLMTALAPNVTE